MAGPSEEPVLPMEGRRNILVTSALPYVNNVPHLGNIIGCVLSADCYARFARARGYNVIYICGTDEYGTATETKALEEGLTCQEICDKYHAIHKSIYEWFEIAFDRFGRTPTEHQTQIAQSIFGDLKANGQLVYDSMDQLYSEALGKFLADRFVVGICPKCGYEDARGDQCDQCGTLLNPTELKDPRCKVSGTTPVLRTAHHIFLNLPQLSDKLQHYITTSSQAGGWSQNCVQVTNAWMRDGLKNRCITRDLKWGTAVPEDGYRDKVFYVWFDAPIGYISITACYTPQWQQWWKNPDNVELVQFMGKDNVPFHTVIFPATLLGTGERWTMMRSISVTEYLNYEGGKFSKSRGTGVFGNDAQTTGIPASVWRYYLLSNRPEEKDTDFKWSDLQARNDSELLANLGNFAHRALILCRKFFDGKLPELADAEQEECMGLGVKLAELVREYVEHMEERRIRKACEAMMSISRAGNLFISDNEPYKLIKLNLDDSALALDDALLQGCSSPHTLVPAGHQLGTPSTLFSKIDDKLIARLRDRFGSSDAGTVDGTAAAGPAAAGKGKDPKSKAGNKSKAKAEDTSNKPLDFSRLDLRVGLIRKAWKHENADALYVEEIDVGEEEPRTVVSGLVRFIPEAEMQNRRVVALCNLKPSKMRGVLSQAMVMAASSADGSAVELVEPPDGVAPGTRLHCQGFPGEPDAQLNPKQKVFETLQPDLSTNDEREACYKGVPWLSDAGPCTVKTLTQATIR